MSINEEIQDASIRHMVWVERYKSGLVKQIIALLNKADSDLAEQIAARLIKIERRGYDLGAATTKRLEELLKAIREQRIEAMNSLYDQTSLELFDFGEYEADFQSRVIQSAVSVDVALAKPAYSQIKAAVTKQPFQGRLLREWYRDLASDQARKVSDAVKLGIVEGQTTDQIVRRIRGTRANQYRDGILEIGRRDAQAIVRTAVAHVSARAQDELYVANDDIIKGVKWVSTLDSRTSSICRARDGKIYPVDSGPRPPAHFNCRSRVVPYLGPTSIKGTRASAVGPVPNDMDYGAWLKKQPVAVQNEVLGVKKAQLFRKGGLSLDRFQDAQGREYTLAELKSRDSEIWNKVFE